MTRLRTALGRILPLCALLTLAAPALAQNDLVALGSVPRTERVDADLQTLPGMTPYGVFVQFDEGTPEEHRALLEGHGMEITADFESSIRAVFALGTVSEVRALTREPSIAWIEEDRPLIYHGDTGPWATRARVALEAAAGGPYRDAFGDVLTGAGIGVAIVDSGIDGTHPDLTTRIVHNFEIVCTTPGLINSNTGQCFGPLEFVDVGNMLSTDQTSGHGTHCAGIAAGDGAGSTGDRVGAAPNVEGTFTGVAPGVGLVGYSTGEGLSVLFASEAWQHIFDNGHTFDPPIRVVNNSFGEVGGATYNPGSIDAQLVRALVQQRGIVMVFAAGNEGGDGSIDSTSSYCDDPTPGVICVANYSDGNTGSRAGVLAGSSSRGQLTNLPTWPDISAPGTSITATCRSGLQPVCSSAETRWQPLYGTIGGTSMATPHVVGAVALLLQARPELTPGEVEDVLLDTAHKFGGGYVADPQNAGSTTSFDKGAGLMNVAAALDLLGVDHDGLSGGGTPTVRISTPGDGSVHDGSALIPVVGTAGDGSPPTGVLPEEELSGDETDASLPGAADIVALHVQEEPTGMRYRITLRDADEFLNVPSVSMRVTQNVDGTNYQTNVVADPAGVTPSTSTAPATSAARVGDDVVFFVPFANLGNPASGAPAHNVFASTFLSVIVDVAPSPAAGGGADVLLRPMYARPYTILRPDTQPPPAAEVRLSLDGGPEIVAALSGTSPDYEFSSAIDPNPLPDGVYDLVATLYLDDVAAASHAITFEIVRDPVFTYQVLITAPRDGDTVPRATIEVRGTSGTDDPSTDRVVTLEVLGHDPIPETTATGTSPWTRLTNFDRDPGLYTLIARLYVDGVLQAQHALDVTVPDPQTGQVACMARSKGFWGQQFDDKPQSRKFTEAETQVLAQHAVGLSEDYYASVNELLDDLFAKGNEGPAKRAGRQYAALLLNLAGGDLSAGMSYQAGLSGSEGLDPEDYDTQELGATVDSATAWIRDQLDGGDLAGANEVGDSINNSQELDCEQGE